MSVTVKVQGAADCKWSALPGVPFVSTLGPLDRTGDGTATIVVEKNGGPARTGTAIVAGQTVTLLQEAVAPTTCVYTVSPKSATLPVGGGTVTFTVTVTQGVNCAWTTQAIGDGMTILSGSQGVGSGSAVIAVAANPGTQRWGGVVIGGENSTIYQPEAPGGCVYAVSPQTFSIGALAQTVAFDVTLTTGSRSYCQFSVSQLRDDPMLRTSSLTPSGSTIRVVLAITENTSASPRSSSVTIAGIATPIYVTVNQAGRSPGQ